MNTKSDPQCKEKGEEDQEVGDFHVFNGMGDEDDAACELCFVAGSSSSWNNIVPHFQRPWPRGQRRNWRLLENSLRRVMDVVTGLLPMM